MKRTLLVSAVLTGLLLVSTGVSAQSPSPTATPGTRFLRVRNESRRISAERIAQHLQNISERRLNAYGHLLDRLYAILDRIVAAADRRAAGGADVSEVQDAIAKARRALDDARAAIRDLASKKYVFADATDLTIADLLRAARHELQEDLENVAAKLRAAHQALREAVRVLHQTRISADES
ncbi:MAG TPA: hypothetical protein VD862_00625 [Candidatus Paceibacterota bacterium]|nr:hypothetical protein [Candidatus Paceibacterota bacterium]